MTPISKEKRELNVVIPDTIEREPVARINSCAFAGNNSIKYVCFPESLTEISGDAFDGCDNLTLVIPESVLRKSARVCLSIRL
ncbi:hypothetical protein AGMMS49975_27130 [Clostridia bacterium]|nr:hypothetical protein AGMMS49975_27130 [Clostridia bacterium]